ncbi:HupE/UreJ family protein [Halieaceae bacterium IMCC14734]|uniref:HupE/UreJ family protein n=1 Tax=Candidatus Litorirhabdus singularis TaxID=2518993 RepID=A0ABT3THC8_9GAMM|nr:HupE/UreJ family protein [Candidatus Litorirhabdus singularis]MCX2981615.1 HupE/UreJ family protein [Candidatus Litorirhabdus singularis]
MKPRSAAYWVGLVSLPAACLAVGHDLSADNARYVMALEGAAAGPFLYLGAKHMFTGFDHLLFLTGVLFYLYRPRDIVLYVTLFTLGHSLTLLLGVAAGWRVSSHLVDAIIGLSIVYKAFENMGGFKWLLGFDPNPRVAVLVFGLCHGLGLATKLQDYVGNGDGLWVNLLSFNLGVELGQMLALALLLSLLLLWRGRAGFPAQAFAVNAGLLCAGLVLAGYQFAGLYFA